MSKKNLPAVATPTVIDQINAELEALNKIEEKTYKTSGKFWWNPDYAHKSHIDIRTAKLGMNIRILGFLEGKEIEYNKAADHVTQAGLVERVPAYEWQGSSMADWEHDIKLAIVLKSKAKREKKLKEGLKSIKATMTAEEQRVQIIKDLELPGYEEGEIVPNPGDNPA